MEKSEYRNIFENEESHFFYRSTHNLALALLKKYVPKKQPKFILDAGCGTGGLIIRLSNFGTVIGIDRSSEAIKFARKRGLVVKKASVDHLPFKTGVFDVVTCIDVLYHRQIKSDAAALREIKRVLKPKGVLIIRVPANRFLMSAHDRQVHTARRYSRSELQQKLVAVGYKVRFLSFVHSPLFLVSLVNVFLERISGKRNGSAVERVNQILNGFMTWLLNSEARLISTGITLPFGQGLIAVATT